MIEVVQQRAPELAEAAATKRPQEEAGPQLPQVGEGAPLVQQDQLVSADGQEDQGALYPQALIRH